MVEYKKVRNHGVLVSRVAHKRHKPSAAWLLRLPRQPEPADHIELVAGTLVRLKVACAMVFTASLARCGGQSGEATAQASVSGAEGMPACPPEHEQAAAPRLAKRCCHHASPALTRAVGLLSRRSEHNAHARLNAPCSPREIDSSDIALAHW